MLKEKLHYLSFFEKISRDEGVSLRSPVKPIFLLAPRHPSTFLRRLCASWPPLIRSRHIVLINRNNYSTPLYYAYVLGNRGCLKTHIAPNVVAGNAFCWDVGTFRWYTARDCAFCLIVNRHCCGTLPINRHVPVILHIR